MRKGIVDGPRSSSWIFDVPATRLERARGLRNEPGIAHRRAMLFMRCRSVHTLGMGFPIQALGLDDELRVLRVWVLMPHRLLLPRPSVRHILECGIDEDVQVGDRFVPVGLERGLSVAGGKPPATLRPSRR